MNGLRLALLIVGLIIIAGIYLWGTRSSLLRKRLPRKRRYDDEEAIDIEVLPGETEESERSLEDREEGRARILVLYLVVPPDSPYLGEAIWSAAEAVGMQFGEMGVFHHFGIGAMRLPQSLFCLANMFEPGRFDLDQMDEFETSGLVLFMPLPPPGDKQVAFELMLNTAQRLSKRLGGELLDEHHEPLSAASIERLRTLVASAERDPLPHPPLDPGGGKGWG